MGFKMKGAPYTSGGAKNINTVLAGKDSAQVPAKRKGTKMYKDEGPMMYKDEGPMMYESGGPKEMDPMHNGEPGVQQEDFKQFSSKGAKYHGKIHTDKEDKKRKEGKYVAKASKGSKMHEGKPHENKKKNKKTE